MKRTNAQKAERILTFLLGLRSLKALEPMTLHGFGPSDVEEGWSLLRGMARYPFDQAKAPTEIAIDYVAAVDAWENRWFGVIEASLGRSFPDIREQVFLNLKQVSGPRVLLSVGLLIQRIEALRAPGAPARWREAFALLQRRGLSDAALVEVRAMLDAAQHLPPERAAASEIDRSTAEQAAWAWYLEWSAIAQKAVSDRRVLRELGYLGHRPLPEETEEPS